MSRVVQLHSQKLSPKEYIKTKARTLRIEKCLVNTDWKESSMANIFVIRKHTNGNATIGLYLIDLLCLGIKNASWFFNLNPVEVDDLMVRATSLEHIEIDYALAHNIIYAGHDFAMEFEIEPHREFEIAKYILQEDNDDVPLIDVAVGDENGMPLLVVRNKNQFRDALNKLKKNAGEGNYNYIVNVGTEMGDEDDDFEPESSLGTGTINDYENGLLLPFEATQINWGNFENFKLLKERDELDQITCSVELNRIAYRKMFPDKCIFIEYLDEEDWLFTAIDNYEEKDFTKDEMTSRELLKKCEDSDNPEFLASNCINALQDNDSIYMHSLVYEVAIASDDISFQRAVLESIEKKLEVNFSLQLLLSLVELLNGKFDNGLVKYISQSNNFFELFPNTEKKVIPKDLLLFWLFKVVQSCNEKNLEKALFYYDGVINTMEISPLLNKVQIRLLELCNLVIEKGEVD
jgi:hypothetical protein